MKLRDQYDWVVLGDHPAALLAAALVAHAGLSVLILPFAPSKRFVISKSGQCFDPESNVVVGLGQAQGVSGVVREALMVLGVWNERIQKNCTPLYPQIATPTGRLALLGDEQSLRYELHRVLGLDRGLLDSILGDATGTLRTFEHQVLEQIRTLVQPLGLVSGGGSQSAPLKSASFVAQLDQLFKKAWPSLRPNASLRSFDHRVRPQAGLDAFGIGLADWMGMHGATDLPLKGFLKLWCLSRVTSGFQGGLSSYREFLKSAAVALGAHAPQKTVMKRLFVENGEFAGVQLANWGNMVSTGGGLLGAPIGALAPYLTYTGRNWFVRPKLSPAILGWRMTVALTINVDVISQGMLSRLVWQEIGAPGLEIEIVDPSGYSPSGYSMDLGVSSATSRTLYLRTVMPWTLESLTPAYQSMMASRMLSQVMKLMPFLEYHVTLIYPDFRGSEKPSRLFRRNEPGADLGVSVGDSQFAEIYNFTQLEDVPSNLLVYDAQAKGMGHATGIGNFFVASAESYPALGSFGATVAAFESVAEVLGKQH